MVKAMILKFTHRLFWIISYAVLQKVREYFNLQIFNGSFKSPCRKFQNFWRQCSEKPSCCFFLTHQSLDVDRMMIYTSVESWGFYLSCDIFFEKKKICLLVSPRPCVGAIFYTTKLWRQFDILMGRNKLWKKYVT